MIKNHFVHLKPPPRHPTPRGPQAKRNLLAARSPKRTISHKYPSLFATAPSFRFPDFPPMPHLAVAKFVKFVSPSFLRKQANSSFFKANQSNSNQENICP